MRSGTFRCGKNRYKGLRKQEDRFWKSSIPVSVCAAGKACCFKAPRGFPSAHPVKTNYYPSPGTGAAPRAVFPLYLNCSAAPVVRSGILPSTPMFRSTSIADRFGRSSPSSSFPTVEAWLGSLLTSWLRNWRAGSEGCQLSPFPAADARFGEGVGIRCSKWLGH